MTTEPRCLRSDDPTLGEVVALVRQPFAYMDGVVDPPSSTHRLTVESAARQAAEGEVWTLGEPIPSCLFLTPRADALYLGRLAVAADSRGTGLARRLASRAEARARASGLQRLRIELTETHAAFRAMGFEPVGRIAHERHDRPTSLTFEKDLT